MIKTVDKTNVRAVDAAYPYSGQKDDTGVFDGTPLNEEWSGDYVQFFERMLALSGITANGLPDNATNDFQLYEAFERAIEKRFDHTYNNDASVFIANKLISISGFDYLFNILDRGTTEIDFVNNSGDTARIISFGDNAPKGTIHNFVFNQDPIGTNTFIIILNSTDSGSNPTIKIDGVSGANTTFSYTIGKTYQAIRLENHWEIIT